MNPSVFAYERAESVQEAIALLSQYGEGVKLIAGGHSLLPIMKLRLAEPERLIDISRIADLQGVRQDGDEIVIGALTTHNRVATNEIIRTQLPLLAATAEKVGDRQVRNRGTIGGALAHADAAADYPASILALDATIMAEGPHGERRIPASDFFVDFLTTALEPTEVLREIRIANPGSGYGWSYQKLANQASGYAIVGVAALLALDAKGNVDDIRVGVTGAAPVAWRATATEDALRGKKLDQTTTGSAAELVDTDMEFLDDLHGSAEYRRRVARGLTRRAILEAASRTGRSG